MPELILLQTTHNLSRCSFYHRKWTQEFTEQIAKHAAVLHTKAERNYLLFVLFYKTHMRKDEEKIITSIFPCYQS